MIKAVLKAKGRPNWQGVPNKVAGKCKQRRAHGKTYTNLFLYNKSMHIIQVYGFWTGI